MDFDDLIPQPREVAIVNPETNEPTGLVLHMRPNTDARVKAARQKYANRITQQRNFKMRSDYAEKEHMEALVAAIDDWEWRGDAQFGGEKPEFTEANVRRVLKHPIVWDQALRELLDDIAFLPRSPTSSDPPSI